MNHAEAVQTKTSEKYLLGELTASQEDEFAEHFFDCEECSNDLRMTSLFLETTKKVLAEDREPKGECDRQAVGERLAIRGGGVRRLVCCHPLPKHGDHPGATPGGGSAGAAILFARQPGGAQCGASDDRAHSWPAIRAVDRHPTPAGCCCLSGPGAEYRGKAVAGNRYRCGDGHEDSAPPHPGEGLDPG